jgi:hypothetical protein
MGEWMGDFMAQIKQNNYRVDVIGVHSYGGPNPQTFKSRMTAIHERYQKPFLITEFAVADWTAKTPEENKYSSSQVFAFLQAILPWMEDQEWIIGYAWFSFSIDSPIGTSSALFDKDGKLTACGRWYAEWETTSDAQNTSINNSPVSNYISV